MPAPLFTSNDAKIRELEGLYIKERNPPATIRGVLFSAVGMFGQTLKGPVGKVVEITSEARFLAVFGGRDTGTGVLVNHVWKALLNKGMAKVAVVRVAAADAVKASFTLESAAGGLGTAICRVDASSPGVWGNQLGIKVEAASDGTATKFDLLVRDGITGKVTRYANLNLDGTADNTATVIGTDDATPITVTKLASGRPVNSAASTDGADADGYVLLGQTVANFVSVAGADGTIADGDYYGAGKGLDQLKAYPGLGVVMPAEYMSATLKAQVKTAAAAATDRLFLVGANSETVGVSTAATDAASYRSDRVVYCYNHAYTVDPVTGSETLTRPESWMAAILAQTDADIHPGEEDTKPMVAGISRLYSPALERADYVTLRAAGISALEMDEGAAVFVSGVTTDLTSGKTEITRRRSADFLQLSVSKELRHVVKKKNTTDRRTAAAAMISAFLDGLKAAGRVVEDFQVDGEILNTEAGRAAGEERILMRVKLIGHMLHVVLETEIGTGVTVARA